MNLTADCQIAELEASPLNALISEKVSIAIVTLHPEVSLPHYASPGAAGADVRASIKEPLVIEPGTSLAVPTGLRLAIPAGYEVQVRPRSGLALKHQITVLNTPGTVDSDYRGELLIILINHGKLAFTVEPGMRIAQLVVAPSLCAHFTLVSELESTERAEGGFGHTGLF